MTLFLGMPGNDELAEELAELTASECGFIETRRFPDAESYVRIHGNPKDRKAFLVCSLADPDRQVLPLLFAARTIRDLGATTVTLVAPYLAYLRQDAEFRAGEAVSSRIFADLLAREFDDLITVDPHLHRYRHLRDIYAIPATAVGTSELIGEWVRDEVDSPILFGPDAESADFVRAIAKSAGCPWATFTKQRHGDRNVQLTLPNIRELGGRTPVLADDIISSGATMIGAAKALEEQGWPAPYCIAVHALFDAATATHLKARMRAILTTDSVANAFRHFRIAPLIAQQLVLASA